MTRLHSVAMGLVVLLALASGLLVGCGDDAKVVQIRLELARTVDRGPPPASRTACDVAAGASTTSVSFIRIDVCRCAAMSSAACLRDTATCDPVPTAPTDGDHGMAADAAVVENSGGVFQIDVQPAAGFHRIDARFLDATGAAFARGHSVVGSFDEPIHVRLYPYGESACAGLPLGSGDQGIMPTPRALHSTIALPNGDVLILGGVQGNAVATGPRAGGDWEPAVNVTQVEVYSVREERFFNVDGPFSGVFFAAQLLPPAAGANPDSGEVLIRVLGGFERGALIDAQQAGTYHGAPVVPVASTPLGDRLLRYDPVGRRLTSQDVTPPGFSRAGGDAVGDFMEMGTVAPVVLGIDGTEFTIGVPRPEEVGHGFVPSFWWMRSVDGTPVGGEKFPLGAGGSADEAGRFGGTVTPLETAALVWGGNVDHSSSAEVQRLAGELLRPGVASTIAVPSGLGIPEATAFHSATRLGMGALVAGGLLVECRGTDRVDCPLDHPITTSYATQPLSYFQETSSMTVSARRVEQGPYQPSVFHAAVRDDPGVLLVGGATSPGLTPSDQIIYVTSEGAVDRIASGGLTRPRWGAAAALLPNDRLLVVGGFIEDEVLEAGTPRRVFRAVGDAEVVFWGVDRAPPPVPDAGLPADTGPPDAGPLFDAGPLPDAGPTDAAPPIDGAFDAGP